MNLAGATQATLVTTNVQIGNVGDYRVIVSYPLTSSFPTQHLSSNRQNMNARTYILHLLAIIFITTTVKAEYIFTFDGSSLTIVGVEPPPSGEIAIPSAFNNIPITAIGKGVFKSNHTLKSVIIPNTICSIGEDAFRNCWNLTSVSIPNSVTNIGQSAFHYCSSLQSITIPEGVTSIPRSAFWSCKSLANVIFPSKLSLIDDNAFDGCTALTSISIPEKVTRIGWAAFAQTSLTNVSIPFGVKTIGHAAFAGCSLLSVVTVSSSVSLINDYAFQMCPLLKSVYFMGDAPSVGGDSFYSTPATIYYIQGKAGWAFSFGGRPIAPFVPTNVSKTKVEIAVRAETKILEIKVLEGVAKEYVVEYTDDLKNWIPLKAKILGVAEINAIDPQAITQTQRFYRLTE